MTNLECFAAYAADFEKTYKDDDWSRLGRYFAPDAIYQVKGDPFTTKIQGSDAIFKGIKKSLDGFDRRFATREVALEGAPEVEGDTVALDRERAQEPEREHPTTVATPARVEWALNGR